MHMLQPRLLLSFVLVRQRSAVGKGIRCALLDPSWPFNFTGVATVRPTGPSRCAAAARFACALPGGKGSSFNSNEGYCRWKATDMLISAKSWRNQILENIKERLAFLVCFHSGDGHCDMRESKTGNEMELQWLCSNFTMLVMQRLWLMALHCLFQTET
jgi:hypothetical protein